MERNSCCTWQRSWLSRLTPFCWVRSQTQENVSYNSIYIKFTIDETDLGDNSENIWQRRGVVTWKGTHTMPASLVSFSAFAPGQNLTPLVPLWSLPLFPTKMDSQCRRIPPGPSQQSRCLPWAPGGPTASLEGLALPLFLIISWLCPPPGQESRVLDLPLLTSHP